jgi:hypothetical protein
MVEPSHDERLERFRAEVAALRVATPDPAGDHRRLRLGGVLLAAGIAVGIGAVLVSHGTSDPLLQRDAIVAALAGVSISIAGAAMYLRYALTGFLRFWLARLVYERTVTAPAVVPAVPGRNGSTSAPGAEPHATVDG